MPLTEQQKQFIDKNKDRLSERQMAKSIGCSRSEVHHYCVDASADECPVRQGTRSRPILFPLLLLGLTFLTFANSLSYELVYDDKLMISENTLIKDFSAEGLAAILETPSGVKGQSDYKPAHYTHYRPLQTFVDLIIYRFFGASSLAYHCISVLFQCMAALLLYFLLLRLLGSAEVPFWTAALFAVHPAQIAAVTYVSGKAESMAAVLFFAAFYAWDVCIRERDRIKANTALFLSVVLYFLSMMTKEIMLVIPSLFFIYDRTFNGPKRTAPSIGPMAGYGGAACLYLFFRLTVLKGTGESINAGLISFGQRLGTGIMAFGEYVKIVLWPFDLCLARRLPAPSPQEPLMICGLLFALTAVLLTIRAKGSKSVFLGWAWLWIFLVPVLNVFFVLRAPIAEHWLYQPIIGIALVVVAGSFGLCAKGVIKIRAVRIFLTALVVFYALTTSYTNRFWKSDIVLFNNIVKHTPDATVYSNLGTVYIQKKMYKEAEEAFRHVLELDPEDPAALRNLRLLRGN